ncbi:MAG: hypothetical protein OXF79_27425 [Chloroflexi bacterium]|nr:hypothetical protein [Chloroflexota bacterium]
METDDRQELIRLMKALGTFNPPDFVRSEELGSQMDFREALPLFEGIRDLFGRLADVDLELATDGMLSSLLDTHGLWRSRWQGFAS